MPIGIAVSGPDSCRLAGAHADLMIAVEPKAELGELFDAAGGAFCAWAERELLPALRALD